MKKSLFLLGLAFLFSCAPAEAKPKEYPVSQILCVTENDANSALRRIQAGEAFDQVARDVSIDPGSKNQGGHILVWTRADAFVQNFATEVKQLGVGQISTRPIRTARSVGTS